MVSIDLIQFLKSSPYVYTEWYSEGAENGLTYMLNGIQRSLTSQTRPATECLRDRNRQQSAQNTGSKGSRVSRLDQTSFGPDSLWISSITRSMNLEMNSTRYNAHCLASDRPKTDDQTCLTDDFGLFLTDDSPSA